MLYFDSVKFLAYKHSPISFDAGLQYRIEQHFTITARVMNLTSYSGAGTLLALQEQVIAGANDYDDIYLNGIFFGNGKILSINFENSALVNREEYTYEIICYLDGNLSNATSGVYSGLSWTTPHLIEHLDESFDFTVNTAGDLKYLHSVTIQYSPFANVTAGINSAKTAATNFFNSTSGLGAFLNSYSSIGSVRKLHTESYNLVDCECSFTEIVSIPATEDGSQAFSYQLDYQVKLDSEKFTEVQEKLTIIGLTSPPFAGAVQGANSMKGSSYSRSNTVYSYYNFSDETLFSTAIEVSETINKFTGTIEIVSTFSNNPKYQSAAIWEYTITLDRGSDEYYTVSEKGKITGLGRPGQTRYANALSFYTTNVLTGVLTRLSTEYAKTGRGQPLLLIAQSLSKDEFTGVIDYSFSETDNNLFTTGSFKKSEIDIQVSNPVALVQKYNVFNVGEIVQTQNQSTIGKKSITVKLKGQRGTLIAAYLAQAIVLITPSKPSQADSFLEECQYSFSPNSNDFSLAAKYSFMGISKNITNINLDI